MFHIITHHLLMFLLLFSLRLSLIFMHCSRYVLTTLHELVADDYILIYFHNPSGSGVSSGNNMPTFGWLKRCYYMIDRKLRKNLKALYLVHPSFWLKTLVIMTKPLLRYNNIIHIMMTDNINGHLAFILTHDDDDDVISYPVLIIISCGSDDAVVPVALLTMINLSFLILSCTFIFILFSYMMIILRKLLSE